MRNSRVAASPVPADHDVGTPPHSTAAFPTTSTTPRQSAAGSRARRDATGPRGPLPLWLLHGPGAAMTGGGKSAQLLEGAACGGRRALRMPFPMWPWVGYRPQVAGRDCWSVLWAAPRTC